MNFRKGQKAGDDEFAFMDTADFLEPPESEGPMFATRDKPDASLLGRTPGKRRLILANQREAIAEIIDRLPEPGETFHVVSNGNFEHFSFVPYLAEVMGTVDEFYGSTWTLNRGNALSLLDLFDSGVFKKMNLLTGLYFRTRETAVYATTLEGFQKRGQRYVAFENHCKVSLFAHVDNCAYISVEGSANYTANPRMENFTVTNDRDLYEMHRAWMEEMLG